MNRKNRGYKRGEPFRDAIQFVIACEGAARERQYFEHIATDTFDLIPFFSVVGVLANNGKK
jgi:hypothetical protein